jgi:hypothetical protein
VPSLTRRRDPNASLDAWLIYYGDVHVGTLAQRAGNPVGTDAWFWHCGFYPGSKPGEGTTGTAASVEAARAAFASAWSVFLSKRTEADFEEWRRDRASTAWSYAMWDHGCKVPTQMADGRSCCFCGAEITIANMHEHIYAAHMERKAA